MAAAMPISARCATAPRRWASPTSTASASPPCRAPLWPPSVSERAIMTIHKLGLSSCLMLAGALAIGCGVDTAEPRAPGDGSGSGGGQLDAPACSVRGPRMTRRLSNLQLRNTLQAVFQDSNVPVGDVLNDPVIHGFKADATQSVVRDLDAQLIMNNAESVADWAVAQKLGQLTSCQSM